MADADLGRGVAQVVDDDRHRQVAEIIRQLRQVAPVDQELNVPAKQRDTVGHGSHPAHLDAARIEDIDADAPDAGPVHVAERRFVDRLVDHGDAPTAGTEARHGVQGAGVVGAIDAGLDDDAALNPKGRHDPAVGVDRGVGRRVGATGRVWEARRRAENMKMAIAGPRRHGQRRRSRIRIGWRAGSEHGY